MEFGPTDRFDVIELKGFEEHEEGVCKSVLRYPPPCPADEVVHIVCGYKLLILHT
jgi:hypothetical protein